MTIKNAKLIGWVLLILLCLLASAHLAHAADTVLEVGIPGVKGAEPGATAPTIVQYISFLYTFVLGFVGIAGFASIVFWGAVWAGSGVVDKKAAALDGIKNALYGIGIALTAFIILNTINPDLTVIKLPTIPGISIQSNIPSYEDIGKEVIMDYIKIIFGSDAVMAMKVADCESKLTSNAVRVGKESGKPADVGVFQINLTAHGREGGTTIEEQMAYFSDYKKNIDYAKQLFNQTHNWDAWYMTQECHSPNDIAMAKKKNDYCTKNPQGCDAKKEPLQSTTPPPPPVIATTSDCDWKCSLVQSGINLGNKIRHWF